MAKGACLSLSHGKPALESFLHRATPPLPDQVPPVGNAGRCPVVIPTAPWQNSWHAAQGEASLALFALESSGFCWDFSPGEQ